MKPEDLDDFSSGKMYVAALGIVLPAPRVEEVVIIPESKMERYKKGMYEWHVIEARRLPQGYDKSSGLEAIAEMCAKYGPVSVEGKPAVMSHEERVITAKKLAQRLIRRHYVRSVYLTGSVASQSDRNDSDVDLLAILEYCPGDDEHREMDKLLEGYPADLFCMQQKDFLAADHSAPLIKNSISILW